MAGAPEAPRTLLLVDGLVDLPAAEVHRAGATFRLTPIEQRLLGWLAARPGLTASKEELLREVWGYRPGVQSRAIYLTIQRLREKIERDPAEPRHLRSIYAVGYRLDLEPGPASPEAPRPSALPRSITSFHGRSDELAQLWGGWAAGWRVVTLWGPGGVGKTRLAMEHAKAIEAQGSFEGGLLVCRVAAIRDLEGLLFEVARALGATASGVETHDERLDRLGRLLRRRGACLLLLDNVEQIVEPTRAALARWLVAAPALRVLLSSRVPIGLPEERRVVVGPLPASEAAELFLARAARARWGFDAAELADDQIRALATGGLDGLPLAIELAAARLGTMTLDQVRERLSERFHLLRDPSRAEEPRHRALQLTLDWSWELLTDEQRRAFAACGAFLGGFDLDAAERVLGGEAWVPDLLRALVDQALLRVEEQAGELRYGLLESVRDYAWERLRGAPGERELLARHWNWYGELGQRWAPRLRGPEAATALQRLNRERENLQVALARALTGDAPEVAAALTCALDDLADLQGPTLQRLPALSAALGAISQAVPPDRRAELLCRRGEVRRQTGEFQASREDLHQALALAEGSAIRGRVRTTLLGLCATLGLVEEGEAHAALALADLRACGDLRRAAIVLLNQANLVLSGDARRAYTLAEEAVASARRVGDAQLSAASLSALGVSARLLGREDEALEHLAAAYEVSASSGVLTMRLAVASNLGNITLKRGALPEAERWFREALSLAERLEAPTRVLEMRLRLGLVLMDAGRLDEAQPLLGSESGDLESLAPELRAFHLLCRAILEMRQGRLTRARGSLDEALQRAEPGRTGELRGHVRLYRAALVVSTDPEVALAEAEDAERLFRELGASEGLELVGLLRAGLRGDALALEPAALPARQDARRYAALLRARMVAG